MELNFKQQSVGETSYLVFDIEGDLEIDPFAMHMMANNQITNVVQTQIVRINERKQIQFDITGLVKLNSRITVPRPKRDILGILNSILNAFEEVDAYMLDMDHLLLDWEYIYLDGQGTCMFMYLPFNYTLGKDKIVFLQEIVSRIQPDYQEKDPYLFDILNAFSRGAVRKLSDFREIIKKSAGVLKEEYREERSAEPLEQNLEQIVLKPQKKERENTPKITETKYEKKSSASSKIPVINIPGRKPEKKEIKKESENKKSEKKGFFRKNTGKQSSFALPQKRKAKENVIFDKEKYKLPNDAGSACIYAKESPNDMYESYENTVIIQESTVLTDKSEETIMLEQPEYFTRTSARLIRKRDGTVYQISSNKVVIGSGTATNICIHNNNAISRNHATIECMNDNYYIEDNHSKNGSYINGRRLQPATREPLYDGMILKFANEDFEFAKD